MSRFSPDYVSGANYHPNYQAVVDKRSEMSTLNTRRDNDAKLAILDPYKMTNPDGRETPDVLNVTMNEAKVFFDRCGAIMNGANMQRIVYGRGLTDKDTTLIEGFYEDIYYQNDLMLFNAYQTSLYGFLIEQILIRGAIAARCLMREDGDKFVPDITPLDTRHFYYETDSQGLIWGAPDITRTKAQILREYGIVIRGSKATVTDFWDDEVNQIFIANQLYKGGSETQDPTKHPERPEKHGLGYPPLIFAGSGAGLNTLFDSGILKYQFESVFASNRGLIPELHRAASIFMTLTDMSFEQSLTWESDEGTEATKPPNPFGRGRRVIPADKGGGFSAIPVSDVRNATRLLYNMIVGALQRGGLPNIDYGNLSFPLSAVAISKLTASKDAIFIPRLHAMSMFYRALSQMIKKQYVQAGYKVEIGEEGMEREYSSSDIDKKFSTKYEFHSTSPEQDIANTAIGQQQMALGMSRHTVFEKTLKLDDPTGEIMKARAEKGEEGDSAQSLYLVMHQQIDDKKFIQAEMTLQQLEMVLRDRSQGGTMGLAPARGGLGAGSNKPMVPLTAGEGGGAGRQPPGDESMMEPEEAETRTERREEAVARNRREAS